MHIHLVHSTNTFLASNWGYRQDIFMYRCIYIFMYAYICLYMYIHMWCIQTIHFLPATGAIGKIYVCIGVYFYIYVCAYVHIHINIHVMHSTNMFLASDWGCRQDFQTYTSRWVYWRQLCQFSHLHIYVYIYIFQ